jgi:pyruvate/2-oxoglutarate dehydrogenase complex dihydrolipoamide dehydrogenase (E3) component
MTTYDAIIIGAGQAGFPLAGHLASQQGWRTALIEADQLGGTCVNYGCTPTKTLVASARVAYMARRAAEYGVHTGPITIDLKQVMARKDERVNASRGGLENWLHNLPNLDVIYGRAELVAGPQVQVNGQRLQAPRIFINTGTRSSTPAIEGLAEVPFLTNNQMLQLETVPPHLVVIGGSYIGLEFAQAFRRFGSQVTIIETQDRLIAREDRDVSEAVQAILEGEGIAIHTKSTCIRVENHPSGIAVKLDCGESGAKEVIGSHLLVSTGRQPNSDLGLETVGVMTDQRGYITVNDRLETNIPGIWALGDVNGRGAFTHTSYNDYEILVNTLFGGNTRRLEQRFPTYGLFIDPPLGRVGMTEAQALAAGHQVLVGKKPMSHIGRALERGETQGFMKFLVDASTQRFLGAAILGSGGDEIISGITNMMYADAPYTVIRDAVHVHPTIAELIPTTLADLKPLA